jgi:hypothetical protein
LNYKPALDDLMQCSAQLYSLPVERRQRATAWFRAHALGLVLITAGVGTLAYGGWLVANAPSPSASATDVGALVNYNSSITNDVGRFFVVKGHVMSKQGAVHNAVVMVSLNEVQEPSKCQEPDCTKDNTTTEGEFTLVLTKIKATDGDRVVVSVAKPGFAFFSRELDVDVRATDAGTAPQTLMLVPSPPQ